MLGFYVVHEIIPCPFCREEQYIGRRVQDKPRVGEIYSSVQSTRSWHVCGKCGKEWVTE